MTKFKNNGRQEVCKEYPNCNCKGHFVYEKTPKQDNLPNRKELEKRRKGEMIPLSKL